MQKKLTDEELERKMAEVTASVLQSKITVTLSPACTARYKAVALRLKQPVGVLLTNLLVSEVARLETELNADDSTTIPTEGELN